MKKYILLLVIFITSCINVSDTKKLKIDKNDYPENLPTTYNYYEEDYIENYIDKINLNYYQGKVIKKIEVYNTNIKIFFTDTTYLYLDIYKYTPKVKFFKKQ